MLEAEHKYLWYRDDIGSDFAQITSIGTEYRLIRCLFSFRVFTHIV